jgi:hypothetical protein
MTESKPLYGEALYYPYIDIDDPAWVRTAILFWNRIQTIVPTVISEPYRNSESRILHAEELLIPLACDLQGELLEDLGRRILKYYEHEDGMHGVLESVNGASLEPYDFPPSLPETIVSRTVQARLHPSKVSQSLRQRLVGAEYDEEGFLLVDERFGAFYMSALATRLTQDTGAVAVSNEANAFGLQLNTVLDEVLSRAPAAADGVLMSVVVESLTLDPSVPLQRVIRFRRKNEQRLQDLARNFEDLNAKIESAEAPAELKEKAGRYYRRNVLPEINKLQDALSDAGIGAAMAGMRNTVTLSAAAGTAISKLLDWPVSNFLLGAGAFVTVAEIAVQTHLAGRKIRRESPYSYLLDVERQFALPSKFVD